MERIKASQNLRKKKKSVLGNLFFPSVSGKRVGGFKLHYLLRTYRIFLSNFHVLVHRGNKAVSVIEQDTPVVLKIPPVTSSG